MKFRTTLGVFLIALLCAGCLDRNEFLNDKYDVRTGGEVYFEGAIVKRLNIDGVDCIIVGGGSGRSAISCNWEDT